MPLATVVCPHCKQDNTRSHCEHWVCAAEDDILKVMVGTYVTKNFKAERLEEFRPRYLQEIMKWAIQSGGGWFYATPDVEKMKRRLQSGLVAMSSLSFPVT